MPCRIIWWAGTYRWYLIGTLRFKHHSFIHLTEKIFLHVFDYSYFIKHSRCKTVWECIICGTLITLCGVSEFLCIVGTATWYMDRSPHPSRPALGSTQSPVEWVLGVNQPGYCIDYPPLSSAEVKERVELFLYSSSGPSWPVAGWIWPLYF
jgi:hypothetical protein